MAEDTATRLPQVDKTVTKDAPVVEKEMKRTVGGKDYVLPFLMNEAKTLDHAIAISTAIAESWSGGEKKYDAEEVLCQRFNGSNDLATRAALAGTLEAQVEGPGKQIDKAAKSLALALGISEAEAREIVVKGRTDRGLAV